MQVEVVEVRKTFGKNQVLKGITTAFRAGRVTALLGPSGSGKTTLLNIIAGLLEPTAGQVLFGGNDVTLLAAEKRRVGLVFQNHALFPHLSAFGNVEFGLKVRGIKPSERRERVMAALRMVELHQLADSWVATLSGGQRQRIALARALVIEPEILLLDEPLSALDVELRKRIREELRSLLAPLKIPTVLVTHDRDDAFVMADEVVLILDGEIVQQGSPEDMYLRPASAKVASFFGEANFLAPRETSIAAMRLFRPEDVHVVASAAEADLTLKVKVAQFLGDRRRIVGQDTIGTNVFVDVDKQLVFKTGDLLHIRVKETCKAPWPVLVGGEC